MKTITLTILVQLFLTVTLLAQDEWILQESSTNKDLYSVDFINDNNGIAVGESGTILKTTNGGQTWQSITTSITNNLKGVSYYKENHAVAVGDGGQIIVTEDGGNTWASHWLPGIQWNLRAVDISSDGKGIASGQSSVLLYTTNGGLNWSVIQEDVPGFLNSVRRYNDSVTYVFGSGIGSNRILRVVNNTIVNTYDAYIGWNENYYEGSLFDGHMYNDSIFASVGRTDFPSLYGCIASYQYLPASIWQACAIVDTAELHGLEIIGNYGIAVGGNFSSYGSQKTIIMETNDSGFTWFQTYKADESFNLQDVKMIGNVAYAVGNEGLIMKKVTGTGVESNVLNETGLAVYPNPSSGYYEIAFTLDSPQNVTINVFDLNGRLINTPFTGNMGTGEHHIINSITADQGNCPTPGVYVITLITGNMVNTAKLIIR